MKAYQPRILCLTAHSPVGQVNGPRLRVRNIFGMLNQIGKVTVAMVGAYGDDDRLTAADHPLSPACFMDFESWETGKVDRVFQRIFNPRYINTHGYRVSEQNLAKMDQLIAEHDLVWVYSLRVANAFNRYRWPKAILDIDDIPSGFYSSVLEQATGLKNKVKGKLDVIAWQRREKLLLERFQAVTVCSELDRQKLGGSDRISVVPNGYDLPSFQVPRVQSKPARIGFIGTLQYAPNVKGLHWFIDKVWPRIQQRNPGTVLRIVGQGSQNPEWNKAPHAEGLGWVKDSDAEMATWDMTVVPIFEGGGTRVKIANAFSRRCPVVSTALGAFGYDVRHGRELLFGETPDEFADACVSLLNDREMANQIAVRAYDAFAANWSWDAIKPRLDAVVNRCLGNSKKMEASVAA